MTTTTEAHVPFRSLGGGFSGVETAGELIDFLKASLKYYPRIQQEDIRVVLLHSQNRLLPELSASLGEFARRKMCMQGLDIRLEARAVRIDDRSVTLGNGEIIPAGTIVCTIGTGVWALGDCAAVPNQLDGKVCPPTAQFADRQARQLARNIAAKLRGQPTRPFSFKPVGQLATIGHNKAVAEMFGLRISGFVAWLLWRGVYLLKIPTLARKTRLFLEWNWAMFFPPDIAHLGYRRTKRTAGVQPVGKIANG